MLTVKLSYPETCHITKGGERLCELPLQEGETELALDTVYQGDFYIIEVRNGRKKGAHKVTDKPLDLSEYLFAGKLEMTISLVARGKIAKKWAVVPVALTDLAQGIVAFDEIEQLKARVAKLEEKTTVTM